MTFASPAFLAALVLLPLGLVAYLTAERRRRRAAEAFAAPAVAVSAVPRRPGWRRHAPLALCALAAAGLIIALARPQASVAVPVEQATIVLATDHSGSMQATDVRPSRLVAARGAGEDFLDSVPDDVRVGAVAFNQRARAVQSPTTDRGEVRRALRDALRPSGGTATGEALAAALDMARRPAGQGGRRPPAAIVLLSNGASTSGRDPVGVADQARRLRVPIYTVALGTSQGTITTPDGTTERVPPDPRTLGQIAQRSGGRAFAAADAARLGEVYQRLGSRLATRQERREVTAAFAAGALLLLLGGAALSLRWFRRLL